MAFDMVNCLRKLRNKEILKKWELNPRRRKERDSLRYRSRIRVQRLFNTDKTSYGLGGCKEPTWTCVEVAAKCAQEKKRAQFRLLHNQKKQRNVGLPRCVCSRSHTCPKRSAVWTYASLGRASCSAIYQTLFLFHQVTTRRTSRVCIS